MRQELFTKRASALQPNDQIYIGGNKVRVERSEPGSRRQMWIHYLHADGRHDLVSALRDEEFVIADITNQSRLWVYVRNLDKGDTVVIGEVPTSIATITRLGYGRWRVILTYPDGQQQPQILMGSAKLLYSTSEPSSTSKDAQTDTWTTEDQRAANEGFFGELNP